MGGTWRLKEFFNIWGYVTLHGSLGLVSFALIKDLGKAWQKLLQQHPLFFSAQDFFLCSSGLWSFREIQILRKISLDFSTKLVSKGNAHTVPVDLTQTSGLWKIYMRVRYKKIFEDSVWVSILSLLTLSCRLQGTVPRRRCVAEQQRILKGWTNNLWFRTRGTFDRPIQSILFE